MYPRKQKHPAIELGPANDEPLSPEERTRFAELCGIVDRGLTTWIEVGKALHELIRGPDGIHSRRLYRETHHNWEAFVRDRWGFGKNYAWRLVTEAYRGERVQKFLAEPTNNALTKPRNGLPIGNLILEGPEEPELQVSKVPQLMEAHVRAMGDIPREKEAAVIEQAVAMGGQLTAAKIKQAVAMVCGATKRNGQAVSDRLKACLHKLAALRRELDDIAASDGGEAIRATAGGGELAASAVGHLEALYSFVDEAAKCS